MQLLGIEVTDYFPSTFKLVNGSNSAIISAPGHGKTELQYTLRPTSIGKHTFEKIHILLRDLAALFYFETEIPLKNSTDVRPKIQKVFAPFSASAVSSYSGTLTSKRKGEGFEFADIREYSTSDEFRKIEWKSSARLNKLMVRETFAETHLNVMVVLDASISMIYGLRGQTKLDYSARAVATILNYLSKRGDYVGLTVFDGYNTAVKPVARGNIHFHGLLETLGSIKPLKESKESFHICLRNSVIQGGVRGRGLYFIISDLEGDLGAIKDQIKIIRAMHHEIVIISPYDPLFEIADTEGVERIAYRIHTSISWKERKQSVREIEKLGIPIFHVGPKDLIPGLLLQIEELRRQGGS
jgi:uncharacterized protein (DUF58 family)